MLLLNIYKHPETDRSPIFSNSEIALKYLILTNRIPSEIPFKRYNSKMNMILCKNRLNGRCYSCSNRACRKNITLFAPFKVQNLKIIIETYLLAIYKWNEHIYEKDILRNLQIPNASYQSIKKHIYNFIKQEKKPQN